MIELSYKNSQKPVKVIGRFLRNDEGKIFQNLMESNHFDLDPQPTPPVTENGGKRVNKKWEFAVPDAFE